MTERYTTQRPFLGLIGRSAPVFLVNGNHAQAARYLLDGTPENVAVWAQNARNALYSQPAPDGFYTGNAEQVPFIGLLRNYFAWTWGDALFVVIDPFQYTMNLPYTPTAGESSNDSFTGNQWSWTLGKTQYDWLKATLEGSGAKYKFVFSHNMLGGINRPKAGVECSSCHMPKVKDKKTGKTYTSHFAATPRVMLKETCLKCYASWSEEEAKYAIDSVKAYMRGKMRKAEFWLSALIDKIVEAKKAGVNAEVIKQAQDQHLKALILWEWWTAENSDGFHNPDMARESLTKSVDESQKGIKLLTDAMTPQAAQK